MWTLIITLVAVILTVLLIFAVVVPAVRNRHKLAHEKLDEEYIYREEPHADQVAEKPNKLKGNKVTKG
jgi:flagellar biosynthesis/type III secretory pathway M-ring protein FliF/YscJ